MKTENINEINTEPQAIIDVMLCDNLLTLNATSRNPINGRIGMSANKIELFTI